MGIKFGAIIAAAVVALSSLGVLPAQAVSVAVPACSTDAVGVDADGDGIGDLVEEAICGSATCATGTEDANANGVSDAVELTESAESGGPAGPIRFTEPGWVQIVLPGPSLLEVPWWPLPVALLGVGVVVALVVLIWPRRASLGALLRASIRRRGASRGRHVKTNEG